VGEFPSVEPDERLSGIETTGTYRLAEQAAAYRSGDGSGT
jgi:hypothetical protein